MLGVVSFRQVYVVDVHECPDGPTTAWNMESPIGSELIRGALEQGRITEPGQYVIYVTDGEEQKFTFMKLD